MGLQCFVKDKFQRNEVYELIIKKSRQNSRLRRQLPRM